MKNNSRHLLIHGEPKTLSYLSPGQGGGRKPPPPRDPQAHARKLKADLDSVRDARTRGTVSPAAFGVSTARGIVLQLEADAPELIAELDSRRDSMSIEILRVEATAARSSVLIRLPYEKLSSFDHFISAFSSGHGKKMDQRFISWINEIRVAPIQALWSEPAEQFPEPNVPYYWEIWLQILDPESKIAQTFQREAESGSLKVEPSIVQFPDRCVVMAYGSALQLLACPTFTAYVAELRKARELSEYFKFRPFEQAELVKELAQRTNPPPTDAPSVCLLDAGVTPHGPLLSIGIHVGDCLTCDPNWGVIDDHPRGNWGGHGTGMAGLALFGDLNDALDTFSHVTLTHRLESVKILPNRGVNARAFWASLTQEAISRAEIDAPERQRLYCMAVTEEPAAVVHSDASKSAASRPTAWSGKVDQLCSGADEGDLRRLFVISAGNMRWDLVKGYPSTNEQESVQSPAQAWNVLTVGAYTQKAVIHDQTYRGYTPIATIGDLSPRSTTSIPWSKDRIRPIKPEIVMEGGNYALDPGGTPDTLDDLQLLTTERPLPHGSGRPFSTFGDTSAATALAARMAARLMQEYPDFWPETIRGLMVHSSEWTPAMLDRYLREDTPSLFQGLHRSPEECHRLIQDCMKVQEFSKRKERLLRCCGWGVPNLKRALYSSSNALTLIAQSSLLPFELKEHGKEAKLREMHLFDLPWPRAALETLGNESVRLRVTLSYFVEPSPGERGWRYRFRYQSHGLRFRLKQAHETRETFSKRINTEAREEDEKKSSFPNQETGWMLGPGFLKSHCGSILSDTWYGSALDLAARGVIGVYPVIGWWRERPELRRVDSEAFYSLLVSIDTPSSSIDIYSPVFNEIQTSIQTSTSIRVTS